MKVYVSKITKGEIFSFNYKFLKFLTHLKDVIKKS